MTPVTADDLQGSFYYPACGTDFWPLRAFADVVSTFVYADWNLAEEEAVAAIEELVAGSSGEGLRLVDHRSVNGWYGPIRPVRVNRNRRSEPFGAIVPHEGRPFVPTHLFPAGFELTTAEQGSYLQRCETAIGAQRPWARQFQFKLRTGDGSRTIELLYFSDEGLARYGLTYAGSGIAPWWLCTFQSGVGWGHGWTCLEEPEGTFERFVLAQIVRPEVWIRGDWASSGKPSGRWKFKLLGIDPRLRDNAQAFTQSDC
jgi:hypothetical protein